jgi:acyl carrier protein
MTTQEQVVEFIGSRLRKMGVVFDVTNFSSLDFATSGIDSLEMLEFIMQIEDKFDITVEDTVIAETTTVGELASFIFNALSAPESRG